MGDDSMLFVSSANLTKYALTLNMELGVLVRGGSLPLRVAGHFSRLIECGVLERVQEMMAMIRIDPSGNGADH